MDSSISLRLLGLGLEEEAEALLSPISLEGQSDEALMSELLGGSREALAILFKRYGGLVHGVALRILKDASEADDLVQDIFVLIHRFCEKFDGSKAPFQFWVLQMTYSRALSRRRYLGSRHFYTRVEVNEMLLAPASAIGQGDGYLEQRLAELDLEKIFRSLSEDQRKTLRLHFIEGYTLDEIAKMLGQTKGNIRHHSFRGLERLRKLIFSGESTHTRAV